MFLYSACRYTWKMVVEKFLHNYNIGDNGATMTWAIWRDYGHILSVTAIVIFSIIAFIGIAGFEPIKGAMPEPVKNIENAIGNFYLWCVILGPFFLLIFGWIFIDYYTKLKEFEKLISTESKAQFIKNLQKIEELAISLPRKYEDRIEKKKIELKVKL